MDEQTRGKLSEQEDDGWLSKEMDVRSECWEGNRQL